MKKDKEKVFEDSSLRQKAENEIETQAEKVILPDHLSEQIPDIGEMQRLLHELEVHQIELEIQNLELQQAIERATTATELYDFAPTGYFTLEPDGSIFQLNLRGAQMLGNVRSKLVESNFMRFVSKETLPVLNKFLQDAFETSSKQTCEIALSIQDKPVYLYLEGIVSGAKKKCLVTAADITERKRMEELLQSKYSLLRIAGITARFGGWVLDLDENKVTWSDEVAAIHGMPAGYSPSLEEGINYYAPEWRNKITKVIADCIQAGIPFDEDMEIMTAKGNRIWVRTIGEAIRTANEKTIAIHGAFQDISERKRAEESLKKSEDLLSLLMKYTPVYTFIKEVTATKSITLNASENYQEMIGIPGSGLIGKAMDEIFPEEFAAKITADDWAVFSSGKIFNQEEELGKRYYRTIKFPIPREDKNLMAGYTIDITDQKQAEKSLRESEARFRGTFDQSPVGSVMASLDSRFIRCNAAFCSFLGYSENELIERTISDITFPEDQELGRKEMKEMLLGTRETTQFQKRYVRKDGRVVWGEISISVVRDGDNQPMYFLPIVQDITERRQAEDLLRLKEEKYRMLFENMTQGVFYQMADGSLVDINPAGLEIFGMTRNEFLGRSTFSPEWKMIDEHYNPLMPEQFPSMIAINTGQDVDTVIGVFNPTIQSYKWLNIIAKPQYIHPEEKPFQSFVTIHDITSRKLIELINLSRFHLVQFAQTHSLDELLEETLNEAEKLTDSSIGFIHFMDENEEYLTLQGWSNQTKARFCNAEGKGSHYSLDKAGVWADCARLRTAVIHNDYASLPNRQGMPEGHAELIRELVVPIFRGNQVKAILGVGNKPTDYLQQDIETISMLAELAWDVSEMKKVEEALKESESRLRDLNVTKDKFFSIIAHDLRSPFNGILGFSAILVDQIQEKNYEGIDEYARIVQNSAKRALSLLMNLLEWSRSQTGLVKFSPEYVEIGILIDEVVNLFDDMAQQKSIELSIELPSKVIAFSDKDMISTILRNLISNALKFTNPGGKIIISAERKPDEILFSVADNGVGMKKDALGKMFRIDVGSSTKGTNNESGTGLGLILCKEFVEKHGGKIWAESEYGKGSTFFFSIPSKQMN